MLAVAPVNKVGKGRRGVSGPLASKSPDTALGHTHPLPMFKPAEGDIDTGEAQGTSLQHSQAQRALLKLNLQRQKPLEHRGGYPGTPEMNGL